MAWRVRACVAILGVVLLCGGVAEVAHASDARHYEKVSPGVKGNGDIVGDGGTNIAASSGDAVTLATRTPFGDTIGSGISGQTQYVARRTAGGWVVHSITPQPRADEYQTFFGATRYQAFSRDLSSAVLMGYDLPGAIGGVPLRSNLYVEDTASRGLRPVTMAQNGFPSPLPFFLEMNINADWGVSADARHVAFVSTTQYLPSAATNGSAFGPSNVYQWDDGVLSLAGILPDGTVPPSGSSPAANGDNKEYRSVMSADGSRLLFIASAGGNRQLYQRIDGTSTVQISAPEVDLSDPNRVPPLGYQADPSDVSLRAATPDGRSVFFATSSPLLDGDDNQALDLYRWTADPDSTGHHLTRITTTDFSGALVVGVSDDGERVYYQTTANDIFVWDHGTTLLASTGVPIPGIRAVQLGVESTAPGLGRVTPDGRFLAFLSDAFDGQGGPTGEATNGHFEVYLYQLGGRLRCVSCPAGPAAADASVVPTATSGVVTYFFPEIRPHFLADGGRVFFTTPESLVPEDVNGVADTYEYDPASGRVSLLSTGKGSEPATFTDASASGNDVFLVTRQPLTGSDQDDLVDLYDARIGDSVPDVVPPQPASSCEGESCQAAPGAPPGEDPLASLTFDDRGSASSGGGSLAVRGRVTFHGTVGILRVRLSGPGTLTWRGRGLRPGAARRTRAGSLRLRLRLTRHARAQLLASGTYTTSVRLTFASPAGDISRTTRVMFKAVAKRGR